MAPPLTVFGPPSTNRYCSTTNMPKDEQQIERVLSAIQAIQSGQIESVREATRLYDILRTTLRRYLQNLDQSTNEQNTKRKLSKTEEHTLVQWIISMDSRGMPPRPYIVRDMAHLLYTQRNSNKVSDIGVNWVYRFIQRHPELKTRFSRKYCFQSSLCENKTLIRDWFGLV